MGTERGQGIERRFDALGISDREWHEQTGIDRKTLRRAIAGEERVRPSTYAAIEQALTKLEQRVGPTPLPVPPELPPEFVEFDVKGEGGFHVVVKGPVKDAALLREQVGEIIRQIKRAEKEDPRE